MSNRIIWFLIVFLLLVGGVFFLVSANQSGTTTPSQGGSPEQSIATATPATQDISTPTMTEQGAVKTVNVENKGLTFVPSEIRVKQGDRVKIVFKNTVGFHDWVLDEFNASTDRIEAGATAETAEFVADQKGTFEYYCSVVFNGVSHRAQGMVGKFIVE